MIYTNKQTRQEQQLSKILSETMIEETAFKNIDKILKPFILCILNKVYHAQP